MLRPSVVCVAESRSSATQSIGKSRQFNFILEIERIRYLLCQALLEAFCLLCRPIGVPMAEPLPRPVVL